MVLSPRPAIGEGKRLDADYNIHSLTLANSWHESVDVGHARALYACEHDRKRFYNIYLPQKKIDTAKMSLGADVRPLMEDTPLGDPPRLLGTFLMDIWGNHITAHFGICNPEIAYLEKVTKEPWVGPPVWMDVWVKDILPLPQEYVLEDVSDDDK